MFFSRTTERVCELSKRKFLITQEEASLLKFFELPLPVLHPEERIRRQLSFKNARKFFRRSCEQSGQAIYSVFPKRTAFPVVSNEFWISEEFNPLSFGFEFDTSRSFFDQLHALWTLVPRPATVDLGSRNSEALHHVSSVKDSFYLFDAHQVENCLYSADISHSRNCLDCYRVFGSEHCCECLNCRDCSRLHWSEHCTNCHDSMFLASCKDCSNCIFCTNLQARSYCIFNKQYSKEQYFKEIEKYNFLLRQNLDVARNIFSSFLQEHTVPHIYSEGSQNVSGNYLERCSHSFYSYECSDSSHLQFCNGIVKGSRCLDGYGFYEKIKDSAQFVSVGADAKNILNSFECWDKVSNLIYCSYCQDSSNLFACVGLRGREYCIFNRQYSKREYQKRVQAIVSYLKRKNIWGKYLPSNFSLFSYEDSLASEYMPLSPVQVSLMGFVEAQKLREEEKSGIQRKQSYRNVPDSLAELSELAEGEQFLCELSALPFSFNKRELEMYEILNLPPPARAFEQRHLERVQRLSPKRLGNISCQRSAEQVLSAFPEKWRQPVVSREEWLECVRKNS